MIWNIKYEQLIFNVLSSLYKIKLFLLMVKCTCILIQIELITNNIYELFLVNILRCDQCSNSWKLEEGALVNCSSKENSDWRTELEEVPHGQWTQILVELQRGLHMSQANNFWDKMLPWQFNCQCILQTLGNDEI